MARHRAPRGRRPGSRPVWLPARQERTDRDVAPLFVLRPLRQLPTTVAATGGVISLLGGVAALGVQLAPGSAPDAAPAVTTLADPYASPPSPTVATEAPATTPAPVDGAALVRAARLWQVPVAIAALRRQAQELADRQRTATSVRLSGVVSGGSATSTSGASSTAAAPPRPRPASARTAAGCNETTAGLGAVKPWVRAAAQILACRFGQPPMIGVAGRTNSSDHPQGLAVDLMIDRVTGDALAACALRNRDAMGITYVIWRQRINTGSGWAPMADRGSPTANHMDHVHISFAPNAATSAPAPC